jgi:hypothetical protein
METVGLSRGVSHERPSGIELTSWAIAALGASLWTLSIISSIDLSITRGQGGGNWGFLLTLRALVAWSAASVFVWRLSGRELSPWCAPLFFFGTAWALFAEIDLSTALAVSRLQPLHYLGLSNLAMTVAVLTVLVGMILAAALTLSAGMMARKVLSEMANHPKTGASFPAVSAGMSAGIGADSFLGLAPSSFLEPGNLPHLKSEGSRRPEAWIEEVELSGLALRESGEFTLAQLQCELKRLINAVKMRIEADSLQVRLEVSPALCAETGAMDAALSNADLSTSDLSTSAPVHSVLVRGDLVRLKESIASCLTLSLESLGGDPGGFIRVSVLSSANSVTIQIEDNGNGFNESMLEKREVLQIESLSRFRSSDRRLSLREVRRRFEEAGGSFERMGRLGVGSRTICKLVSAETLSSGAVSLGSVGLPTVTLPTVSLGSLGLDSNSSSGNGSGARPQRRFFEVKQSDSNSLHA